jgi:flagellar FliJ protein
LHAAEARAGALRRDLLALETRVASVRKLMERREQHAAVVSNRSEQRRADEASQRGHRRASARAIDWRLDSEHAPLTH